MARSKTTTSTTIIIADSCDKNHILESLERESTPKQVYVLTIEQTEKFVRNALKALEYKIKKLSDYVGKCFANFDICSCFEMTSILV